jgi:Fungal specific transcription factor domain
VDSAAITGLNQPSRPLPTSASGFISILPAEGASVTGPTSVEDTRTPSPPAENANGISQRGCFSTPTAGGRLSGSGDETDSMIGAIGGSSSNPQFFGSSSAGSFMRQIKAEIDFRLGRQFSDSAVNPGSGLVGPAQRLLRHRLPEVEYVLPSRNTADSLVENYWNSTHPVYPFLDRASLGEDYRALWTGSRTKHDERVVVGTINIVFALGAQVSKAVRPELRQETGKMYYDRAQDALGGHSWDICSVDLVSYLLLTGVFLQTVNIAQRCWMVIRHAIRMAQSIGLHLPHPNIGTQSRREVQVTRRIWHGCILMDR